MKYLSIIFIFLASNLYSQNSNDKVEEMKKSEEANAAKVDSQRPAYIGGDKALFEYISNNIKFPPIARRDKIQGKVVIKFIIRKDGSIADAKVEKGIGGGCDEEALRVVSNMPNWIPGKNNGIAVETPFTLPISFKSK
jgi:periplasmic protein TonB